MTVDDDQARFRALFEAHRGAVLAYARRRVGSDTAPDVVADTFLVAWRRLDAVPPDALPWLYGVARRIVADDRRAGRRSEPLIHRLGSGSAGSVPSPERALDTATRSRKEGWIARPRARSTRSAPGWSGRRATQASDLHAP